MAEIDSVIYLDNAATSHPKPAVVGAAVLNALNAGGNPGRGGHRMALNAGRLVFAARDTIAAYFGLKDSAGVIFTASATDALNLAVKGLLQPGDHCITTSAEHNALRRPLVALGHEGVQVTWLPVSPVGLVDPAAIRNSLRPNTRLIAIHHGSNVTGAVQPIADIAEIAHQAHALLLVDAAQTAGCIPLPMAQLGIDLLAAPGHKGLLGPQGTGILCTTPSVPLRPIREGGTGFLAQDADQPAIFPEGFESGTLNVPGIAGLAVGIASLRNEGAKRELEAAAALGDGLRSMRGVTVYGPTNPNERCSVVSFTIDGMDPREVEERLDEQYGILGRSGLHCNPGAHAALGTLALGGTMRLSPGRFTTQSEIAVALAAVGAIAASKGDERRNRNDGAPASAGV